MSSRKHKTGGERSLQKVVYKASSARPSENANGEKKQKTRLELERKYFWEDTTRPAEAGTCIYHVRLTVVVRTQG